MKKKLLRMSGLILAALVLIGAGRLWAESQDEKPAPRTRIGLINLTYVIKNYSKYQHFQEEIKQIVAPLQKHDQKLRAQLDKLRAQAQTKKEDSSLVPVKAEDLEEKAKKIQRELEDNSEKAKRILGKRSDEEMRLLYRDVEQTAKRYAAAHELDLVLHYNDAITEADYYSTQNIARKLNTGALMPLYMTPGVDISKELVQLLEKSNKKDR
jgi:Skp family chaperone for outer membrane proteins